MGLSITIGGGSSKPAYTNLPKLGLVPLEGDLKGTAIMTGYNPTSLKFTKEMEDKSDEKTIGTDVPVSIKYSGSKPIELDVQFFFDCYEAEEKDVRPIVMQVVHLAEPQVAEAEIDISGKEVKITNRPPKVCFVWKDTNPLGTGTYYAYITKVTVNYTMFLDDGTPCRATVDVHSKQVNPLSPLEQLMKATSKEINTAGLTAAAIETLKGGRAAIEAGGGKIEDPSTWPVSISIQF